MTVDGRSEREATVSARLHALLGARGGGAQGDGAQGGGAHGVAQLESLHREACTQLGAGHQLTLLIECHLTELLGLGHLVEESLAVWVDLQERARYILPDSHNTLIAIRSGYACCLTRRGHPGDLDRVVELRREGVNLCVSGDVGQDCSGIARTDLAVALLDRGRFGWLDPSLKDRNTDADLARAGDLIEPELERRATVHGPDHPFTWRARAVRCAVLVALAQRAPVRQRQVLGTEALALAEDLVHHEWRRSGTHTPQALRRQVLRAGALLALDRDADAEREARLAAVLARRYSGHHAGCALLVLARALVVRDSRAALAAATQALATRLTWFSSLGHQVAEAKQLVDAIGVDAIGIDAIEKGGARALVRGTIAHRA